MKPFNRLPHPKNHAPAAAEKLEDRIAPAVLLNAKTLTYFDADGDIVTLTISKGKLTAADFVFDLPFDSGERQQLRLIDFAGDLGKAGANLSISAEPEAGGNGVVDVGYIKALGIDLGNVTIDGDLARIDAGDAILSTAAVQRLNTGSMGVAALATQAPGGNLTSHLNGPLGKLTVVGDFKDATLLAEGGDAGRINRIEIGGSIIGGDAAQSGSIRAQGTIGPVHIGGSIIGGAGLKSGQLASRAGTGAVEIGGSVIGGVGRESGAVGSGGAIVRIAIAQDLIGYLGAEIGGGESSGALLSSTMIGSVTIGCSIAGGAGFKSGIVATKGGISSVTVQGSVLGGSGVESGAIGSDAAVGVVKVMGDVWGGTGEESGHIVSKTSINKVLVKGFVRGGDGDESGAVGALGSVTLVRIDGDLLGGLGLKSGWVASKTQLASVVIGGALGNNYSNFAGLISGRAIGAISIGNIGSGVGAFDPGSIRGGTIGTLAVTDSIFAGSGSRASIRANSIGVMTVGNDIDGFGGFGAQGSSVPSVGVEIAIRNTLGRLTVGGNVSALSLVVGGGFDSVEQPANPDAQAGPINVGGSWDASSIAVGVLAGSDGAFGTLDDVLAGGGDPDVFSRIARIQIGGTIGTGFVPTGFIAEQIGALSESGGNIPLNAGPRNDAKFLPNKSSAFVRENNVPLD